MNSTVDISTVSDLELGKLLYDQQDLLNQTNVNVNMLKQEMARRLEKQKSEQPSEQPKE